MRHKTLCLSCLLGIFGPLDLLGRLPPRMSRRYSESLTCCLDSVQHSQRDWYAPLRPTCRVVDVSVRVHVCDKHVWRGCAEQMKNDDTTHGRGERWAARQACGDSKGAGPPHSARHSGPSRDLTTGYRSLESILKRGRWKALSSVHRYAKPHAYYACVARVGPEEATRGDSIIAGRPARPASAGT